jgi:hypothetical protein
MKKTIFYFFLLGWAIFKPTKNIFGQNLQFNQAVFNTYGPGNADGNQSTPMFTGSLVVGANQVLKITSGGCSSVNAVLSGQPPIPYVGMLSINDFHWQQSSLNQLELWLPTGTYTVKGYESSAINSRGSFTGMISGILYDIVP